ncbi:MAG: hypothetical protein WC109_03460 [Syntrophomonadaceae bacterium]|nr:hypothetical protein [Syntrophomonadaceae bacterium]MDD3898570.1 hypothetical protein [Syntrophomonadaceae bacterium]
MGKLKYGIVALLLYALLASVAYATVTYWNWNNGIVYSIAFLLSVVIWYEALNRAFARGLGQGIGVIFSYIVPSLIISYLYFTATAIWASEAGFKIWLYELFHLPLIFGLNNRLFPEHPLLIIIFPSLLMLILAVYPFSRYITRAMESQHTQYIFR